MSKLILETPRLALYEFTTDDRDFIFALLNSPGWLNYIGNRNIITAVDAENYITTRLIDGYIKNGYGFYKAVRIEDSAPVGMCGITKREGLDEADIGFALLPEFEGNGYIQETGAAVLEFAKNELKLTTVSAITVPYNKPSIKVLEKLGLKFEKTINIPDDDEELMLFKINFMIDGTGT